MRILIAEDEPISRRILETTLKRWGHEVLVTCDGAAAWGALLSEDAPRLAILDVVMPGLGGIEVCHRVRVTQWRVTPYLILLTARIGKNDVVQGLEAGANDYVAKPFDPEVLRARVNVGLQMLALQESLAQRVSELEEALSQVKQLQGLLPICSYCKSIRDDRNYWQRVESYISRHGGVRFSHGICPDCYEKVVQPQLSQKRQQPNKPSDDAAQAKAAQ